MFSGVEGEYSGAYDSCLGWQWSPLEETGSTLGLDDGNAAFRQANSGPRSVCKPLLCVLSAFPCRALSYFHLPNGQLAQREAESEGDLIGM